MLAYTLYKIGEFLANCVSLKIAYKLAIFFSDLRYFFSFEDKKNVLANLKVIFPNKTKKELCRIRLAMARNFSKYLVDFFRSNKLDKEFVNKNIILENDNFIKDQEIKNRPVILLTAHIGNWEMGGMAVGLLGHQLFAVALPHKSEQVNKFFDDNRQSKNVHVIPFGKAGKMCIDVLKNKKTLVLLGDRDFSKEKGILMDFFGKKSYFPKGPATLAIKYNATVIACFMVRLKNDKFKIFMEPAIDVSYSDNMESLTKRFIGIFEKYIRLYPEQWFMFKKFWADNL